MHLLSLLLMAGAVTAAPAVARAQDQAVVSNIQVGPRPFYLVDDMSESPLEQKLASCSEKPILRAPAFSISHRGAPLQFPEHSRQGMLAAARMGAGIAECDVAFTKDRELVCRHSQCDLHTTTNILMIPELAAKCSKPFTPATADQPASAKCCTSDITLAEFKSLCAKMYSSNSSATTPQEYQYGGPAWRTSLYNTCATPMEHNEYIELTDSLGLQFTPELKSPEVAMPFQGSYTQEMYAQQLIDDYKRHGIDPGRVWPQSFRQGDILFWIDNEPSFGKQAIYLDERVDTNHGYQTAMDSLPQLAKRGVKTMAPPIFALLNATADGEIVPSEYAVAAKDAGLDLVTWSLERSGPLQQAARTSEYYVQSVASAISKDGDMYRIVDALARKVGVRGIFSDWPAMVTYYANCMGFE
jgi:glycerophosphoryl diester phosphodiesterase